MVLSGIYIVINLNGFRDFSLDFRDCGELLAFRRRAMSLLKQSFPGSHPALFSCRSLLVPLRPLLYEILEITPEVERYSKAFLAANLCIESMRGTPLFRSLLNKEFAVPTAYPFGGKMLDELHQRALPAFYLW